MTEADFSELNNENDPATCRGRAAHARMAAQETTDQDLARIFERLAELYEAKATKLEGLERRAKVFHSADASEPPAQPRRDAACRR